MPEQTYFDKDYYDRYYHSPKTRVTHAAEHKRLGTFLCSYLRFLEQPVTRVLDLGCGIGYWQRTLAKEFPRASYTGVEHSKYLCDKYGWQHGSVADYQGKGQYDLVICQDVIQYLPDKSAARAIQNIAEHCRGLAFIQITTAGDWRNTIDQKLSDKDIQLRKASWYRRRLSKFFRNVGGGLFLPNESGLVIFELQALD